MKTEFKVNHRYLVKTYPFYIRSEIYEITVLEISKEYVKIRYITNSADGPIEWEKFEDIKIVEDLGIYTCPDKLLNSQRYMQHNPCPYYESY